MNKKDWIKLGVVYVFVFFLALYMDTKEGELKDGNLIYREESGGITKEIELWMNAENVLKDYKIHLEIEPRRMTKTEAENCFLKAMEEIDADMMVVEQSVDIKERYADGVVSAEWDFSPTGIIAEDGRLCEKNIPEDGIVITVSVNLQCDSYEKVYRFPLRVEKPWKSIEEKIEMELSEWIESQQLQEGKENFYLPDRLAGVVVTWTEEKEYLSVKVLCLEILFAVFLIFAKKREQEELTKCSRWQRELQYPEIVNQLLILMEAGMTTRQAWQRIAYQYIEKRKQDVIDVSEVYEAVVQMERRLTEGENERSAYENFGRQMDAMCYRRLMRLLVQNLEKGSRDICQQLSMEAKHAYEQRVLLAKKLGEEASTKMLIPMMLMMLVVMVIVMAPAMMSFSV